MLEAEANDNDPFEVLDNIDLEGKKMFKEEREMYGDILNDVEIIMTDYFEHWDGQLVYMRKNKKGSEHKFKIDIMDGVTWEGKIDGFAKTPNKLKWLVEHKSFNQMPNEDARWRNIQSTTYHRAVDILGWFNLDGSLWDYIWSKPPTKPQILKKGGVSQKQIKTLPTKILQWQKQNKIKDIGDLLYKASLSRSDWFQRIFTRKNKRVIDMVWEDFEASIKEIVERSEKDKIRTIDRHCSWCSYESICRAELYGGDVDFIIEREYTVEDPDKRYQDTTE
jgi:hypothetical protein